MVVVLARANLCRRGKGLFNFIVLFQTTRSSRQGHLSVTVPAIRRSLARRTTIYGIGSGRAMKWVGLSIRETATVTAWADIARRARVRI